MGALEFSTRSQAVESDRGERKMTEAEVLRTHVDLFNGALKSRDWDQLAAIYSDDYMLVRPDGAALSKQEVLKDLQIGGLEFKAIEMADVKVRIHGDNAILTATSRKRHRDGVRKPHLISDLSLSMWLIKAGRDLFIFRASCCPTDWMMAPALKRVVLGRRKLNDRKTKLSETNRETLETQFAAE